jgi:hypothetical protein
MNRIGLGMALVSLGLVACAGAPPPHERQAQSEAAVRGAREIGAERVPQAALHLKLAEEGVARGKAQIRDGDNRDADYTLMRAQADADLALALTRESRARLEAQQAADKLRTIGAGSNAVGGGPSDPAKRAAPPTDPTPPASPGVAPASPQTATPPKDRAQKEQPMPSRDEALPPAKDQPPSGSTPAPKSIP